jgi:hypothetical protein
MGVLGYRNPAGWSLYEADRGWIVMDCGPVHGLEFGANLPLAQRVLELIQTAHADGQSEGRQSVQEAIRAALGIEEGE